MRRRSILRSGVGLLAVVAAALGLRPAAAAEIVNIYNARHYGTDQQLWDAFKAKTGIEVNVIDGAHDALIQRMLSEGRNSPADLFITVDAGRLAFAAGKDLLAPTKSAVLESTVPEHLREPDGRWFGLAMRARVLIYAKDRVQPSQLSTYEALADPAFKGKVLVRSSTNVYNLSLVGSILEANGRDKTLAWCEGLVANMARPPEGGDSDQIKAVAAGVGDVAISNTYYLASMAASEKADEKEIAQKVAVFFPNQKDRGTHVNISGAGVVKHRPAQGECGQAAGVPRLARGPALLRRRQPRVSRQRQGRAAPRPGQLGRVQPRHPQRLGLRRPQRRCRHDHGRVRLEIGPARARGLLGLSGFPPRAPTPGRLGGWLPPAGKGRGGGWVGGSVRWRRCPAAAAPASRT